MTIVLKSQAAMATCHNWTEDTDVVVYGCMYKCIQYHCGTITMIAEYPPIAITWLWCQYPDEVAHLQPLPVPGRGVIIVKASILITLLFTDKICNEQINLHHLTRNKIHKKHDVITNILLLVSTTWPLVFMTSEHHVSSISSYFLLPGFLWWIRIIMNHGCNDPSMTQ